MLDAINLAISNPELLESVIFSNKQMANIEIKYTDLKKEEEVCLDDYICNRGRNGSWNLRKGFEFYSNKNSMEDYSEVFIKFNSGLVIRINISQSYSNRTLQIGAVELQRPSGITFFKDKIKLREVVYKKTYYYKVRYENLIMDLDNDLVQELIGKLKTSWNNHIERKNLKELTDYLWLYKK